MAVYVHFGTLGACPDCGEDSFIQTASLIGDHLPASWTAPAYLIHSISKSMTKNWKVPTPQAEHEKRKPIKKICCSHCSKGPQKAFWLEPAEGSVLGPLCKECLVNQYDEMSQRPDLKIFATKTNRQVLAQARATLILGKVVHDTFKFPDSEDLFFF